MLFENYYVTLQAQCLLTVSISQIFWSWTRTINRNHELMAQASRTKRTLQNSRMALVLFVAQVFVGFYSRKIFLDYLGDEVIGLNTTLGNILGFLNLAELGIGMAIATSLYQPIHDENHETVCEIMSVQGILYKRIALLLCILGVIVMLFLPFFFPDTECGLAYVELAFAVFMFGSITSYLWNYRSVLISVDQKDFKLTPWRHLVRYAVMCLQIFSLIVLKWGIWGWLMWELVGNVATVFVINYVLHKEYPWMRSSDIPGKELLKKYKHLMTKTKQLFVHKLGYFALKQTTPIIIYAYVSLTMVTYYGNYIIITGYVSTLLNVIFGSMSASIGSLVADRQRARTLEVFWELFSSRIWIAFAACVGLYLFTGPLISLWLGSKYVLDNTTLLLILIGVFIQLSRSIVDSFKDAYQLFADVWAPIVESIINVGCSILFGYLWGLNGILLGSSVSLVLIVLLWKPYYLFRHGLKASCMIYYMQYALHIVLLLVCAYISVNMINIPAQEGIFLLIAPIPNFLLFVVLSFVMLYLTTKGMRQFAQRIIRIITHKI